MWCQNTSAAEERFWVLLPNQCILRVPGWLKPSSMLSLGMLHSVYCESEAFNNNQKTVSPRCVTWTNRSVNQSLALPVLSTLGDHSCSLLSCDRQYLPVPRWLVAPSTPTTRLLLHLTLVNYLQRVFCLGWAEEGLA